MKNQITLIYENICREAVFDKLVKEFDSSFKIKDWSDSSIPTSGFFLGSIAGCNWLKENRPDVKFFSTFENYKCSVYYPKLQDLLFNDRYAFIPFQDLARRKWDLYSWLGKESLVFVRPDSGEKDTPAQLVDLQDMDKFVASYDYHGLAVVSSPKNILGEWRFVVTKNKIIAVSSYRFQGVLTCVPSAPKAATVFVEKVLENGYHPDPLFCIDVAQDMDGNFWVMELTSFSSAGLYACNPKNIADAIKDTYS